MNQINRRSALAGVAAVATTSVAVNAQDDEPASQKTADQSYVMAAGMTADEAKAWKLIAEAAGAFFALPELHPLDKQEVATAVHVIQNKLLGRPTYRKYLELAKAGAKAAGSKPSKAEQ
jgi:hypothetical protein